MSRTKLDYNKATLEFLDSEDLLHIELKSKALTFEECLDFLCIKQQDIPPAELEIALMAHKRGRANAIVTACDNLFGAMKVRGGAEAAIHYLKQTSKEFKVTATNSPGTGNGFSFTVNMPEE